VLRHIHRRRVVVCVWWWGDVDYFHGFMGGFIFEQKEVNLCNSWMIFVLLLIHHGTLEGTESEESFYL
jgi:hypothetical protein